MSLEVEKDSSEQSTGTSRVGSNLQHQQKQQSKRRGGRNEGSHRPVILCLGKRIPRKARACPAYHWGRERMDDGGAV